MAKQRKRRRSSDDEGLHPLAGPVEGTNKVALRAFRLSLWSLVPGAGLFLGPVAVFLGIAAHRRGKGEEAFTFQVPASTAIVLGSLTTVTNWIGLVLIIMGLRSIWS